MIYALVGAFFLWLISFLNKAIVEKWYNKTLSVFLIGFFCFVLFSIVILLNIEFSIFTNVSSIWEYIEKYFINYVLLIWFLWWMADFIHFKARFIALSYLPVSLVVIVSRLFSSILILCIWFLIYWENLSYLELFWFFLWIFAVSLLYEHKKINDKSYKSWLLLIFLVTLMIVAWNYSHKDVVNFSLEYIGSFDINFVLSSLLINFLTYTSLSFIDLLYWKYISKTYIPCINIKWNIFFNLLLSLITIINIFIVAKAYSILDFAIAYKIFSYSMFVAIFLTVIFYWEELTKKKILAFSLTAVSILMFY